MSDSLPDLIRQANRRMTRMIHTVNLCDHPNTPGAVEAIGTLVGQIQGQLDQPGRRDSREVENLLTAYASTLTELQSTLEQLHGDLRHRHAELREEKKRLDSATAWSNSYRTTV